MYLLLPPAHIAWNTSEPEVYAASTHMLISTSSGLATLQTTGCVFCTHCSYQAGCTPVAGGGAAQAHLPSPIVERSDTTQASTQGSTPSPLPFPPARSPAGYDLLYSDAEANSAITGRTP